MRLRRIIRRLLWLVSGLGCLFLYQHGLHDPLGLFSVPQVDLDLDLEQEYQALLKARQQREQMELADVWQPPDVRPPPPRPPPAHSTSLAAPPSFNPTNYLNKYQSKIRQHRLDTFLENVTQTCSQRRNNIVYIKEIKCASQTIVSMLRRFAYEENLQIVLPLGKKIYLGWPYLIDPDFYRPSKTGEFNILCEHSVFNEERMSKLMPKDTVYVTSIREPFSEFKSLFNYYKLQQITEIEQDPAITEYLLHISKYDAIYKSDGAKKLRYCIPNNLSMSQNLMSFNLGFPTGFQGTPDLTQDTRFVQHWLDYIDSKFSLVMIVEYFAESMVMLRRMMCWDMSTILYLAQNVGTYDYKAMDDPSLVAIYRNWSRVDYQLYESFNKTFWKKVKAMPSDFTDEVTQYKHVIQTISQYCATVKETKLDKEIISKTVWNAEIVVNVTMCEYLSDDFLMKLHARDDKEPPHLPQPKPRLNFC